MSTLFIVLACVAAYFLGWVAVLRFCGYMNGRNGPRFNRGQQVPLFSNEVNWTKWETLAAWSFAWPVEIPVTLAVTGLGYGIVALVQALSGSFKSAHNKALDAAIRKQEVA